MDRPNRRLFLGCRSKVMAVMDADRGKVITTLPIGDHVDATAFDPETRLIFNSNGEGTITVIHQESSDKYSVVETVKTVPRAKTMALDPKTHQLFCRRRKMDNSRCWSWENDILTEQSPSSMNSQRASRVRAAAVLCAAGMLLALAGCAKKSSEMASPVNLQLNVKTPFRFVAYGDTRFHDPRDTEAANPRVRLALVQAIAEQNPEFVCFTGDIVYNGFDADDWKVWDSETSIWRDKKILVYPALGNHDLHGEPRVALSNYFQRFPDLNNSRYYSVRAANALVLVLDSSMGEVTGPQGQWLADKLDHVPSDVDFVFLMFHHPPYTSSSDERAMAVGTQPGPRSKHWRRCWKNARPMLVFAPWCSPGTCTTTNATSMAASPTLSPAAERLTPIP